MLCLDIGTTRDDSGKQNMRDRDVEILQWGESDSTGIVGGPVRTADGPLSLVAMIIRDLEFIAKVLSPRTRVLEIWDLGCLASRSAQGWRAESAGFHSEGLWRTANLVAVAVAVRDAPLTPISSGVRDPSTCPLAVLPN